MDMTRVASPVSSPLPEQIDQLWEDRARLTPDDAAARETITSAVDQIDAGQVRVAWLDPDRDAVADGRLTGKVIHVFITGQLDDVDQPGEVIRGVTWHRRGGDHKYVILSTVAPERVLAHELGHVFGLPHSEYAISIMNKRPRTEPPIEQRAFADAELAAMRPVLRRLLREQIADITR